jgi:hypothetical protein
MPRVLVPCYLQFPGASYRGCTSIRVRFQSAIQAFNDIRERRRALGQLPLARKLNNERSIWFTAIMRNLTTPDSPLNDQSPRPIKYKYKEATSNICISFAHAFDGWCDQVTTPGKENCNLESMQHIYFRAGRYGRVWYVIERKKSKNTTSSAHLVKLRCDDTNIDHSLVASMPSQDGMPQRFRQARGPKYEDSPADAADESICHSAEHRAEFDRSKPPHPPRASSHAIHPYSSMDMHALLDRVQNSAACLLRFWSLCSSALYTSELHASF